MATASATPAIAILTDQNVVMRGIGWRGYSTILQIRGGRGVPKLVYLDGNLWLISLSFPHEQLKARLNWFVCVVVEELDIPCISSGSITFRREKHEAGVEGDESFYLANEERFRGKREIDLRVDPPPDLAIEVVYSHPAREAVEVYRRLSVPEVWVCDEDELVIRLLGSDGLYSVSPTSAAIPFLTAVDVFDWVRRPQMDSETRWIKDVRRWVADTLPSRRRNAR